MNNTEEKKTFSWIGFSYLAGAIVYYLLVSIVSTIIYKINPDFSKGTGSILLSFGLLFFIGYPFMYLMIRKVPAVEIPKKKIGFGMWLVVAIVSYFLLVLCNIVGLIINSQLGKLTGKGIMNPITGVFSSMGLVTQIIIVCIMAPIAEELIFRKFIVDRVYKYGEVLAALTSGMMFGLFHGNFQQFVYAFGLGFFLAFVYIRTGKIINTIGCHMLVNFLGSVPAALFMKGIDIQLVQNYIFSGDMVSYMAYVEEHITQFAMISMYGTFMMLFILAGLILAIVFRKKFKFESRETDLEFNKAAASLFVNTGMILFGLWWIFNIALAQFGTDFSDLIFNLLT